jgi:hypothetical protein
VPLSNPMPCRRGTWIFDVVGMMFRVVILGPLLRPYDFITVIFLTTFSGIATYSLRDVASRAG